MTDLDLEGGTPVPVPVQDLPLWLITPAPEQAQDALCDPERLTAVLAAGVDDPERVQPLVEGVLAQTAAQLATPVSMLNVLLSGVQVIAGGHGLSGWLAETRSTPAEWSLCATVVRTGRPYVVPDLATEPATAHNPLCAVDGFRAYAGVPLRDAAGQLLGALCVVDVRPRDFDDTTVAALERAAEQVSHLLGTSGSSGHR